MFADFLKACIVGGLICVIGQLLMDLGKLTPAHTMCVLVVSGAVLGALGLYQPLADWAGFGAKLPISSFGNSLFQGALEGAGSDGFWGLWQGLLKTTSAGIGAAIVFAFTISLFFKAKN